jgi:hypothetical protein
VAHLVSLWLVYTVLVVVSERSAKATFVIAESSPVLDLNLSLAQKHFLQLTLNDLLGFVRDFNFRFVGILYTHCYN